MENEEVSKPEVSEDKVEDVAVPEPAAVAVADAVGEGKEKESEEPKPEEHSEQLNSVKEEEQPQNQEEEVVEEKAAEAAEKPAEEGKQQENSAVIEEESDNKPEMPQEQEDVATEKPVEAVEESQQQQQPSAAEEETIKEPEEPKKEENEKPAAIVQMTDEELDEEIVVKESLPDEKPVEIIEDSKPIENHAEEEEKHKEEKPLETDKIETVVTDEQQPQQQPSPETADQAPAEQPAPEVSVKAPEDKNLETWLSGLTSSGVVGENCPVCKVPFATIASGPSVPMLLSCGHTICAGCLAQLKADEMKSPAVPCPLCGNLTPFEQGKPVRESVMVNESLMCALNLKQKLFSQTHRVHMCAECSNAPASVFCHSCSAPLCEKCDEVIHCGKVLTGHRRVPIKEYEQQIAAHPLCQFHQLPLDRFCVEDKTVCCAECLQLPPHIGHRTVPLSEAPQVVLQELSNSLSLYSDYAASIPRGPEQVLEIYRNAQKDLDDKVELVRRAIVDMTEAVRHAMEQRAHTLSLGLEEQTMTQKRMLQRSCDAAMVKYVSAAAYADVVARACAFSASGSFDSSSLSSLVELQKLANEAAEKVTRPRAFAAEAELAPFLLGTEDVSGIVSQIATVADVTMIVPPVMNIPSTTVVPNAVLVEWLFAGMVPRSECEFELEMARGSHIPYNMLDFSLVYRGRDTQYYVEGLESGTEYWFRCRALSPVGKSAWSRPRNVTTERVQGFAKGSNYSVSPDGFVAEKLATSAVGWNATITGKIPLVPGLQHRWSIEVRKTCHSNIFVGVAPMSIDRSSEENGILCGYYMFLQNGSLYSGPPYNARGYAYANNIIPSGSVVGVIVDLVNGVMGFTIHGRFAGLAFVNLPTSQPLVPVVLMCDPGDTVVFRDNIEVFSPAQHPRVFFRR